MTREFKQRITLPCSAKQAFEILLDSRKHTKITGSPAFLNKREGAKVSTFNGLFLGRNIEIALNKKIVQVWRSKKWAKGVYSVVSLTAIESSKNRCTLELTQVGIPTRSFTAVKDFWGEQWLQVKGYLAEKTTTKTAPKCAKTVKTLTGAKLTQIGRGQSAKE